MVDQTKNMQELNADRSNEHIKTTSIDSKQYLHQDSTKFPNKSFSLSWQVITF